MLEIERKFLVKSDAFKNKAFAKKRLTQGYLNSNPHRTVRIRIADESAFITIKGIPDEAGVVRFEWEKEIEKKDAEALLTLAEEGVIDKTRFLVKAGQHTYEVDEFYGDNAGLLLAEIELKDPKEAFIKPEWIGEEVTGDINYYNSQLSKNPFLKW